ncbi:MAG: hypothetical protein K9K65_11645 [Desulfarculaceae bacterium]|nr:hypothetical protein [Desulfarculaceae bacterium]MCF8064444.1 hypothetical protein [Desulfarculaceae bacterium]MCF8098487.1 hypothetical protein [Desulfarculaceae bacterium]MCF8122308.1 hypothetical protein [Desulfarculaceae bacterium]
MERMKNIDPFTKTVPGHGAAGPGQELPREVPPKVARHLELSGGWERVAAAQLMPPILHTSEEE